MDRYKDKAEPLCRVGYNYNGTKFGRRISLNPTHAQKLLSYMAKDLRLDVEYPVICDLEIDGISVSVSTIWYTDNTGDCLVKVTAGERLADRVKTAASCRLRYQDISLEYLIETITEQGNETKLGGYVLGSFGDSARPVTTTNFLIPNLPDSLGDYRDVKRSMVVNDELVSEQSTLDFGAIVLGDERWEITLTKVDQIDSPQHDYRGIAKYGDREPKTFDEHLGIIDSVSLFITWICGSERYPAYAVSYHERDRVNGFVHSFEFPSKLNNRIFGNNFLYIREAASKFGYFCELLRTPDVQICIRHAIRDYAEAYNASNITSKLANTHAALTAIVRWDRTIPRGTFAFVDELENTISSLGLDSAVWNPVAKDINTYRSNSLHVQPKWAYHDDPRAFRVWMNGQMLVEYLLAAKFELGMT